MQLIPCSCAGSASQSFTAPQRCRTAVALTARAPPTLASRARMGTTPPTHWHQHWHPRRYRKSTWAPHRTDVPRRMRRHAPHRRRGHADRPCTGLGLRRHAPAPAWACAGMPLHRPGPAPAGTGAGLPLTEQRCPHTRWRGRTAANAGIRSTTELSAFAPT